MNITLNGFGEPAEIEATRARLEADHGIEALYNGTDMIAAAQITGTALPVDGGWTAH